MNKGSQQGRLLLLMIIVGTLLISIGTMFLSTLNTGANSSLGQAVRLIMTLLLSTALYQGKDWARKVFLLLYGLGGLWGLYLGFSLLGRSLLGAVLLSIMSIVYIASALMLYLIPSIDALFERHKSW